MVKIKKQEGTTCQVESNNLLAPKLKLAALKLRERPVSSVSLPRGELGCFWGGHRRKKKKNRRSPGGRSGGRLGAAQPSPILPGMTLPLHLLLGLVQGENNRSEPTLGAKDDVSFIVQASSSAGTCK